MKHTQKLTIKPLGSYITLSLAGMTINGFRIGFIDTLNTPLGTTIDAALLLIYILLTVVV
jgi:hypothetical protein